MNLKKFISGVSAFAIAASAFAGMTITANATDPTTIYERGYTTGWSDADLSDWTAAYVTPSIDGGLSLSGTNAGFTATKAISLQQYDIVEVKGSFKGGGASGRSGSYDYIKVSGVEVRDNEQDKELDVYVNSSHLSEIIPIDRSSDHDFDIVINTALNKVTKLEVKGTDYVSTFAAETVTAPASVVFGHSKAGRENYGINTKLTKLEVIRTPQTASDSDYTINYIYNDQTIKQTTGTSAVGSTVYAENPITVEGQKYYVADGATTSKTLVASASDNVLNVNMRQAETYTTQLISSLNDAVLNSQADVVEGDSATLAYPRFIKSGTAIYEAGKNSNNDYYRHTFSNVTAAGKDYTITYSDKNVGECVYYSEAEDIEGMTECAGVNYNIHVRCSMGKGAKADSDVTAVNLPAGKYRIYAGVWGNSGVTYKINAGATEVLSQNTMGYFVDAVSDEFTLSSSTDIIIKQAGDNGKVLDYIYIVKTGDYVPKQADMAFTLNETISELAGKTITVHRTLDEKTAELSNLVADDGTVWTGEGDVKLAIIFTNIPAEWGTLSLTLE